MEIKPLCHKRIAIGKRRETYCMAPQGHKPEDCKEQPENADLNAPIAIVVSDKEVPETCGEVNPRNQAKCGLPKLPAHDVHSDGMRGWDTLHK